MLPVEWVLLRKNLTKFFAHADEMCLAEQLHRQGLLPKRICHCDTKVNNMMFDKSGNVLCVIDLGYGYAELYLFGLWRLLEDCSQYR